MHVYTMPTKFIFAPENETLSTPIRANRDKTKYRVGRHYLCIPVAGPLKALLLLFSSFGGHLPSHPSRWPCIIPKNLPSIPSLFSKNLLSVPSYTFLFLSFDLWTTRKLPVYFPPIHKMPEDLVSFLISTSEEF